MPAQQRDPNQILVVGARQTPFSDVYHHVLRAPWWLDLLALSGLFLLLNLVFAFAYLAVGGVEGAQPGSLADHFFFSVQTMGTIGYGAMLFEGLVGVMAIIAAAALNPGDYFAINTSAAVYANLGMAPVNLGDLQQQVGEVVAGRPGGAVSLAVGMAQIFSKMPGMRGLMDYWYHFAIMFEALFILTTIDAGTRVGRFVLQEFGGRVWTPFGRRDWMPGSILATTLVVLGWAYFIFTGSISTIWPMFGIANQLLAVVALALGTTVIINIGRGKYAWATLVPMCFVATTTLTAGFLSVRDNFWPMVSSPFPAIQTQGYVNTICTIIMMICVVIILTAAVRRWLMVATGRIPALELVEAPESV